jgi:hypothetical protein
MVVFIGFAGVYVSLNVCIRSFTLVVIIDLGKRMLGKDSFGNFSERTKNATVTIIHRSTVTDSPVRNDNRFMAVTGMDR